MARDYATYFKELAPLWFREGLDPAFTAISGARAFVEGLARRLTTPRGGLIGPPGDQYDPAQGILIHNYLNKDIDAGDISVIQMTIEAELKKDERVLDATAIPTFSSDSGTLTLDISGVGATGPFQFTITVDKLTAALLSNAAPTGTTVAQGNDYGTDVSTYPSVVQPIPDDGLVDPWGDRFLGAIGSIFDVIKDAAKDAVKVRFVAECPTDALPYHASERMIDRLPGESDEGHRIRLEAAWDIWEQAGTAAGIAAEMAAYGLTCRVLANRIVSTPEKVDNWQPRVNDTWWSTFSILVTQPIPFDSSTGPSDDVVASIRKMVAARRPAHALGVEVIFVFEDYMFGPPLTFGSFTFADGDQLHVPLGTFFSYGPLETFDDAVTFQTVL